MSFEAANVISFLWNVFTGVYGVSNQNKGVIAANYNQLVNCQIIAHAV